MFLKGELAKTGQDFLGLKFGIIFESWDKSWQCCDCKVVAVKFCHGRKSDLGVAEGLPRPLPRLSFTCVAVRGRGRGRPSATPSATPKSDFLPWQNCWKFAPAKSNMCVAGLWQVCGIGVAGISVAVCG